MNKIYRKLWSTTRQCWVVASELTTTRGKAAPAARLGVPSALALSLLLVGSAGEAHAIAYLGCDAFTSGPATARCIPFASIAENERNYATGNGGAMNWLSLGAGAWADGNRNTAIGVGSRSNGDNSSVFGYRANSTHGYSSVFGALAEGEGEGASAFGNSARARGRNSIAFGSGARTAYGAVGGDRIAIGGDAYSGDNDYTGSIALGGKANARYNSTAIGFESKAQGLDSLANGYRADARAQGSIALGANSIATRVNEFSVGNATLKRKITNVDDGNVSSTSYDAVNGRTLQREKVGLISLINGAERVGADALRKAEAADSAARGAQSTADRALASATTNGYALATGSAMDNTNKATASGNVSLAMGHSARSNGVAATAIGNSAKALAGNAIAIGSVAEASGDKSMALGGNSKATHSKSVALGEGSVTTAADQVSVGTGTYKRTIVNVKDGAIAAGSSEVVTGNQLHATNTNVNALTGRLNAAAIAFGQGAVAEGGTDNRNAAVGYGAKAYNGNSVAFGVDARAGVDEMGEKSSATGSLAMGANSRSGNGAVAAGLRASAVGDRGVAVGNDAAANATRATAIGYKANASGGHATALGTEAVASGQGSVAMGDRARSTHNGSVALGVESQTTGNNQVSVGNNSIKRKIVNMADGQLADGSSEAVTGNQLHATNRNVTTAQNTANAAVTKANALEGLVAQVAPNGNVRVGGENTGATLDVRNKANANRKVTGVADATLNGTSTEAVTGRQLNTTNTNVTTAQNTATAAQTAAGNAQTTANTAVTKANALEGLVAQVAPNGNVRVGGENTGATLDVRNKANANRTVSGVADGAVRADSSEAVNGKQLFATDQKVTANEGLLANHGSQLTTQGSRIDANRRDLDALRGEFDNFDPDLDGVVKFAADGSVDVAGGKLKGVAAGDISSAGSTDAVNGGQLFATNVRLEALENGAEFIAFGGSLGGGGAQAGQLAIAIGESAEASLNSEGAVALGAYSTARGRNSVALGRASHVTMSADRGFALGAESQVAEVGGVALGSRSSVESGAVNAVAIGMSSIAKEENTVSFGNDGLLRRLVNVERGRSAQDVTTVAQLQESILNFGAGAGIDANGNIIAPTYNVQGGTQNNVGDALTALDSAVVTNTTRTDRVESQLRAVFQDSPTVRNDGRNQLTFAGANGMVLSNVANGAIAAGSRDAVNGGQLHSMQQQLNGRMDGLEGRIDGQPQAPQSRALTIASAGAGAPPAVPAPSPQSEEQGTPTPPVPDNKLADNGTPPPVTPQADAPKPEAPTPQVDTAELEKMLARANDYSDGISREVDRRLDKMDKRFNRMAAMSSAQSAMAMNTAGLNTYNRLGAGVGYSDGESAMAVGYQRVLNDKGSATFSLNGAFTNSGERSMGVGVGIGW